MVLWNIAALVGVPGVGKTSLCRSASGALGYMHLNYGELMLEVAKSEDLASNQEEMFKLDIEIQESIWRAAALKVVEIYNASNSYANNILLDLHGVDKSETGYIVSLPVEIISPDIVIVVESSYENIIMRRKDDKFKTRPLENKKSVDEHMEILRVSMAAFSVIYGSYFSVIENNDFEKCLSELREILSR
jgi:adenylate kinase